MIRVGIVGAAGYTGGELIRILANHPEVELEYCQSNSQAGKAISEVHTGFYDLDLSFEEKIREDVDVLFFCMGHGRSKSLLEQKTFSDQTKIIDLSHDYRIKNGHDFIYGLPELFRDKIKSASRIANPGCFATAIQLALLPVAKERVIQSSIHVHGITGSTGAGQSLSDTSHFSWRNNNVSVYKAFGHQHLAEINQSLQTADSKFDQKIHFVPVRGNFTRGILSSAYFETKLSQDQATKIYREYYREHPFVQVIDQNPDIKMVVNTNMCLINVTVHNGLLHIISVIDNLTKGASGQATQNMNLMFGINESTGLHLKSSVY
jgi:N-acetyl-gamma-glutamyl-phosphate reductase